MEVTHQSYKKMPQLNYVKDLNIIMMSSSMAKNNYVAATKYVPWSKYSFNYHPQAIVAFIESPMKYQYQPNAHNFFLVW